MTGNNEIHVNQQEMCRLMQLALKADVIREGVAFEVTKVEVEKSNSYSNAEFTISINTPDPIPVPK